MDVFLSIIIPCYNVEAFLPKCLQSLSTQTKQNEVEFILVNDGSTDDTLKIIQEFVMHDDRAVLIDKKNGGVSSARNEALKVVRGKYVYLLDGDDYLRPDAVEIICKSLRESGADMLFSNLYVVRDGIARLKSYPIHPGKYTVGQLYDVFRFFPTPPQNVYRMQIVREHGLHFDEQMKCGEVYAFTVSFFKYTQCVSVIEDAFFYYVMRGNSATHGVNCDADRTTLQTLKSLYLDGEGLLKKASFHITAFKIVSSFTYNKYVKAKISNPDVQACLKSILNNPLFKTCLYKVAFGYHSCWKERVLALYMLFFSIVGFKILVKLYR